MNDQEEYLNKINAINHMPTFTYLEIKDSKTKKYHPGKRHNIGKFQIVDHRTAGSNEIIWDFDYGTYTTNYELAKKVIDALNNRGWKYNIFASGGKGIHISVWFNKVNFDDNDKLKEKFKEARSFNLNYKKIRLWLWELVLKEANIEINKSLKIDNQPIKFIEEEGKYHAIRCCGGRKIICKPPLNKEEIYYKTYVPIEEFNKTKPKIKNFKNVKYPTEIECIDIDPSDFMDFLMKYISRNKDLNISPKSTLDFNGTFVDLQSVKALLDGVGEGTRAMGARIIAIACKLDGFNEAKAEVLMKQYVENCPQTGTSFTIEEGMKWVDWVYSQQEHFWNCSLVKELGVHEDDLCEFCKQDKKEILEILEDKNLLKRIDNFLSTIIVGEDKNRILTFLLMLSCKCPVDDEWNLPGNSDPKPASIIYSSMSASGKSYLTKALLKLFGKRNKDYYVYARMTKSSLNYFQDVNMNGKLLFVEELQGLDADSNQLRLWISEGRLTLSTVEKDDNDKNVLVNKETIGQPVFLTGTAEDTIDEQMNNRSWLISLDVSQKQNKAILNFEDKIAKGKLIYDEQELRILQDSIRELKSYHFIVPYYDNEIFNIPTIDVRIRRDYAKFRYMICCSGLLHQKQRITFKDDMGRDYLICNFEDYEIAKYYSEDVLQATFSGLTNQQIELVNNIKNQYWADKFECKEVQMATGLSQSKVYKMLEQIEEIGLITSSGRGSGGGRGNTVEYSYNPNKQLVDLKLPSRKELEKKWEENNPKLFSELAENGFLLLNNNKNVKIDENTRLFINKLFLKGAIPLTYEKNAVFDGKKKGAKTPFFGSKGKNGPNQNSLSVAEMIIKYLKDNQNHMVEIQEISEKIKADNFDVVIENMLKNGEIFEPKPGRIMLL